MNQIIITGNLGSDPEYKTVKDYEITEFALAHTPRKKVGNDWVDGDTIWFRVKVWGKQASAMIDNLSKGTTVTVIGTFGVSTYEAKDGTQKSANEITATEVTQVLRVAKQSKSQDNLGW